ncbi:MAG: diguanylate cyclase [Lachnospiraceae bacterium]|nr:diguanylate cyclase [Lachnospiraceae bacterium]
MNKLLMVNPAGGYSERVRTILRDDFDVVIVKDEDSCYRLLDDDPEKYPAVIIDLDFAEQREYYLLKKMAGDKIFASIPVIAVTDRTLYPEDMECLKAGFSDILTPPLFREQLINRINNAIRAKDSFTYSEMQKMLKQLPSNIYLKDSEGKYVFATQYWHHLNQEGEKHWTIRGKTDVEIRKDKQNALKAMETDREMLATGKGTNYIIEENDDGVREYLELIKRPVFDDDGNITGIIALINDVTETQLLKMELEERSKTDALTGLLNKGAVEELVSMMLTNYYHESEHCALMVIDVDNFKTINDNYGHATGDSVLSTIGRIIQNIFKGMDVAGRIGGDEFMVFLRDIDSADDDAHLAMKLQQDVRHAFRNKAYKDQVTLSIGISLYPGHGKKFRTLYDKADQALYYVKKHGKGSYHIYSPEE